MAYSIGQQGKFLFKMHGEEFTVDAHIIAVNGAKIQIEYVIPANKYALERGHIGSNTAHRWLRSRQERERFLTDITIEIKRGAPAGNKNAALSQKTIRVYVSLSPERAIFFKSRLAAQIGHVPTDREIEEAIRSIVYAQIDGSIVP